jgi:hypothetical protein
VNNRLELVGHTKSARSMRSVPLPEWVAEALAEHVRQYPSDDPDGIVIQGPRGHG